MSTIKIFRNNLVAIIIHIAMCFACLFPINYLWWGVVWTDSWFDGEIELRMIAINFLVIGIYTAIVSFLYFLASCKLLCNRHNAMTNLFSVSAILIVLTVIVFAPYESIINLFLRIPYLPLGETISYFLHIQGKYAALIVAPLPSLIMWIGLSCKNRPQRLQKPNSG